MEKKTKGRKFIALQEGLGFGILYIIACALKPVLIELVTFAIIVIGLFASFMGANAIKSFGEKKKMKK